MGEKTPVSTRAFSKELRQFAFGISSDFKRGHVQGVEMQKAFWLPTSTIKKANGDEWLPFRKLSVRFNADRDQEKNGTYRPSYIYALTSVAERSIEVIPEHIMNEISLEEDKEELLEHIEESDGADISESVIMSFSTSDIDISDGEIQVVHSYEVFVGDQNVYENDDDDILYPHAGERVEIPAIESLNGSTSLFIEDRVTQEQISDMERVASEIAFRAIVEPFNEEFATIVSFDDAANRIRVIMDILQKGVNVERLYDLR